MQPLQACLAESFETIAPDWPGFGTGDKPGVDWTPAAGYVLRHFFGHPEEEPPRIVLIAPTWCGPLPTMMRRRPRWLARVRAAIDMPVIGSVFYALNLSDLVIWRMAKGHVYSDSAWLTPERLAGKRAVVRAAGARFASVRFMTGQLIRSRRQRMRAPPQLKCRMAGRGCGMVRAKSETL
ncbi:MAG: hypothetical protein AAF732_18430 [Pseudomonadota bacterium]